VRPPARGRMLLFKSLTHSRQEANRLCQLFRRQINHNKQTYGIVRGANVQQERATRDRMHRGGGVFSKIKIMFALRQSQRLISAVSSAHATRASRCVYFHSMQTKTHTSMYKTCSGPLFSARSQLYCNERKVDTHLCFSF
jgi:hypothetical protein